MYLLADGNPIILNELGNMPMVEYYAMLNKHIAMMKKQARENEKNKSKNYG